MIRVMVADWTPLDRTRTEAALAEADLRVLLMVMWHLSDDPKWREARFLPARDVQLIADEEAGLDPDAAAELRAGAAEALCEPSLSPALHDPGDEMVAMMSACLGEKARPEYALMMREEMGFAQRRLDWRAPKDALKAPVVIAGAGPSGLALGAHMEALGLPYVILEARAEVGGAWNANRYPGCAVDTPNHAYSFSFGRRQDWTRYFSPQPELLSYLMERSEEFGVRSAIRFETALIGAEWDEAAALWRCRINGPEGEEALDAAVLISAIGPLAIPKKPPIAGLDEFNGPLFHSAEWPEGIDLSGKRVAVIGTGASAMQICPSIVDQVESLTIYQRSAQWARDIPRFKDAMSEGARWLIANVPYYAEWFRFTMLWRYGDGLLRTLKRDPDWPHPERAMNRINDRHREGMVEYLLSELEGRPDLIQKAMPDYPPFGKRILLDNGWFRMLRRDNVELVVDPVDRIEAGGVVAGELREADVVILATGFIVHRGASNLDLKGRGGVVLADQWADENPRAYKGLSVPNFPNLFIMQGPGTGLAHGGSAIFTTECMVRYVTSALKAMIEGGAAAMEVREDVHDEYMDRLDAEHRELIWAHPGMTNWYKNRHGRVFAIMPWRLVDYWAMTREIDLSEYRLTG